MRFKAIFLWIQDSGKGGHHQAKFMKAGRPVGGLGRKIWISGCFGCDILASQKEFIHFYFAKHPEKSLLCSENGGLCLAPPGSATERGLDYQKQMLPGLVSFCLVVAIQATKRKRIKSIHTQFLIFFD